MKYIEGTNRQQLVLFPRSLDEIIGPNNEVRILDRFVNTLNLKQMGFKNTDTPEEGRPAYHPSDLLKLYIYGYLNRTRSSRELEKETHRNVEVIWLLKGLHPDHNTIANFRRDNPDAIRQVFRQTVQVAQYRNLVGGSLIAGDSVKLRAQNSKKNNYNQDKIDRHIQYIDNKLEEYNTMLEQTDLPAANKKKIQEGIQKQQLHKSKYQRIEQKLKETGEAQVSTSDPDSRQMIVRNNITEVAYNTQTTVDSLHKLILDYKVTNHNDTNAMGDMVKRATEILQSSDFTVLFDKGYHTGEEIRSCHEMGVETLVAVPDRPVSSQAPDPAFNYENFRYDSKRDLYICPQQQELASNGVWYTTKRSRFKQYKTSGCKHCPVRDRCTISKKNGRVIQRSECADNVIRNQVAIEQHPEIYKLRQSIVEHPYGTIKRQWGFDHTLMKRFMGRVSADIGLVFLAYNLRRLINIVGNELNATQMLVKSHCFLLFGLVFTCHIPETLWLLKNGKQYIQEQKT